MSKEKANMNIDDIEMDDLDLSSMASTAFVAKYNLYEIANNLEADYRDIKKSSIVEDIADKGISDLLKDYNHIVEVIDSHVTHFADEVENELGYLLDEIYKHSQKLQELRRDIFKQKKEIRDGE